MKTTVQVVTLVSIFTLALACSSSSSDTPAGTAGHAGAGTAGAGTAGAGTAGGLGTAGAGTAGAGTAGAGTAGAGTAGAGTAGAAACAAPSAPLIDDFSGTGGLVTGMIFSGGDPAAPNAPTFTMTDQLVVTFNGGTTMNMYPYEYIGLPLDSCTDASAYTGVTFNISGTLSTGCTIQFSAVDVEHNTVANGGTCMGLSTSGQCYVGGKIFTLPATPTDVMVNFADIPQGMADPGAAAVDATQLRAIQWQANPPAMMGCTGTVTIDNVMFF